MFAPHAYVKKRSLSLTLSTPSLTFSVRPESKISPLLSSHSPSQPRNAAVTKMDSEFSPELQSRVSEILHSFDNGPMESLFFLFLSSDQLEKSTAVVFLECSKKIFPDLLFINLCFLIRFGSDLYIRAKAIRILQFLRICDFWPKFQETEKSILKDNFLAYLKEGDSMPVLRMFCAVVAETLCETYKDGQKWPELLKFLLTSLEKTSDNKFQEIAFLVLAKFPRDFSSFICDSLKHSVRALHSSFLDGGLASASPNVQVASLGAVVTLVPLFTDYASQGQFQEILRAIMAGVFTLSRSPQNSHVLMAFNELISLVSKGPHLLKPHIGGMVSDMLKIVENSALNKEIHCYAVRLIMTLTEREDFKPIFLSLPHETMVRLFLVPVKMLLCIEEDMTTNESKGKEDGSTGKTNVYNFGLESLYHLSVILGGNKIIPIASELLSLYLESPEWQKRHVGITLFALIGKEFSFKTLEFSDDSLSIMFTKFMKLFQDTQFQVRLAAFNFMATPTIFVQLFQLYYHSRLLPAFATALGAEKNDKVKEQVASAILFFLKNTLPDSFSFRAGRDELIMKLLVSVQGDVTPKHKSILLSAFNIVAEKCATVALEFQSSYLPILLEACNDENYEVKEEAARGIRICAESESQEVKRLMKEILSKLYFLLKHPNQPLRSLENAKARDIAVSALGRICKCHRDCIDASNLVPIWLSFLPLKEELNEAKIMHEQLCLMVYGSDMDLLGPENQNLAKIIVVFVEVIEKGKTLATPETVKTMTHLLGDLMLLSMNSQQQQLLSSLVSS